MRYSIPGFSNARVLVVGDLMLDRYWYGTTSRISPEAPVPVVNVGKVEERAGGAGNVALNVAALGCAVTLIGFTGDDQAATSLKTLLERDGVRCKFNAVGQRKTSTKLRVISRHQQLIRLDFEDGFADVDQAALSGSYARDLAAHDLVILSDYGKGTLSDVQTLIAHARRAGKPVLIDPKGADFARYRGATAITPNQTEFEAVAGICADDAEMAAQGQRLLAELELDALLVTRSEKGILLLRAGSLPLDFPTHVSDVFDVTGAGDTVIGVLGAALAVGTPMPEAVALANLAAGVVVRKLGTAIASLRELQTAMLKHKPLQRGLVTEVALLALVEKARASGESVVMTNGCFDILHAGHVAYLSQAAQRGDRLVVAVNDDDSVRRLKGKGRPVNPLMLRMAVLAGLESVDWVVSFTEDTPRRLIEALSPDTLVKGGDYRPDDVAGGDCVRACGGEVVVLDFIDGCSTSAMIAAIRKDI
ncbi:MAG: bifunctional D-glycero-beta-D-manno-heptose-7-phosphate kinase/D-glycero-beta-D-manno-heptose 1-phosphate adenylyltransferase HldE [Gammaproteobacteria bacterium]|nr:bifunctional D-glycero-beta-D-manno-heptose-7-phosphate kinase/D-glycero-beta-D-manno-heptose 1-phosphate adenylyltransferase HldE [Gammaproteobacteria bacterium]